MTLYVYCQLFTILKHMTNTYVIRRLNTAFQFMEFRLRVAIVIFILGDYQ